MLSSLLPVRSSDMSYQNHSAVNFTELGLSEAQRGSGQHEEVIKPGLEAGGNSRQKMILSQDEKDKKN